MQRMIFTFFLSFVLSPLAGAQTVPEYLQTYFENDALPATAQERESMSRETQRDCDLYLTTAQLITQKKWKNAELFGSINDVLQLSESDLASIATISSHLKPLADLAKNTFKRPRPYVGSDSPVVPCIGEDRSYYTRSTIDNWKWSHTSFPSSHSVQARVAALVLSWKVAKSLVNSPSDFLSKTKLILQKGAELAMHRVLAGHHYPSDIRAGEMLTDKEFCGAMKATEIENNFDEKSCNTLIEYLSENAGLEIFY